MRKSHLLMISSERNKRSWLVYMMHMQCHQIGINLSNFAMYATFISYFWLWKWWRKLLLFRLLKCLLSSSSYLLCVGSPTISTLSTLIIIKKLSPCPSFNMSTWDFIGWQCPMQCWILLFTIGWMLGMRFLHIFSYILYVILIGILFGIFPPWERVTNETF